MKRRILEFKEFSRINEMTDFGQGGIGSDNLQIAADVGDPTLSINSFDRQQNTILAGISKINTILYSLANTGTFRSLKSIVTLENQDITKLDIVRIVKSDNINYDVYVRFIISDNEYWGVIERIMDRQPNFKSEVFTDFDLTQSKEWVIKIKGLMIKIVRKWLEPEEGNYKLVNDNVICYSVNTGRMLRLEKNTEVEVIRSYDSKIVLKYNNDYYNLVGDNYIYFNYWFTKI
jgi:hypothetical protein